MAGNKLNIKSKAKDERNKQGKSTVSSPSKSAEDLDDEPDLSLLRKSIQTSVTGFAQARKIFDSTTEEVKSLISVECDLIYECKVCRNLYRSLVNFISHKRVYCKLKFSPTLHAHFKYNVSCQEETNKILQLEAEYSEFLKNRNKNNDNDNTLVESEKFPLTKDLTTIIERLTKKTDITYESDTVVTENISLEKIPTTKAAVYQHVGQDDTNSSESTWDEVNELENMVSEKLLMKEDGTFVKHDDEKQSIDIPTIQISDDEDSEGNVDTKQEVHNQNRSSAKQREKKCQLCDRTFSTWKTCRYHMKSQHLEDRIVYPCPECGDLFSSTWSALRHLFKVHKKTATQIRRLRDSISLKAFRINNPPASYGKRRNNQKVPPKPISDKERIDQENQVWMAKMEADGELPRCAGCGRRFERRAALIAHTQICLIRRGILKRNATSKEKNDGTSEKHPEKKGSPVKKNIERENVQNEDEKSSKKIEQNKKFDETQREIQPNLALPVKENQPLDPSQLVTETESKTCILIDSKESCKNIQDNKSKEDNQCEEKSPKETQICKNDPLETKLTDDASKLIKDHCLSKSMLTNDCDNKIEDQNRKTEEDNFKDPVNEDKDVSIPKQNKLTYVVEVKDDDAKTRPSEAMENDDPKKTQNSSEIKVNRQIANINKVYKMLTKDNGSENLIAFKDKIANYISLHELKCKSCNVKFITEDNLNKHMAKHFQWKRFSCRLCGFACFDIVHCRKHMQSFHKIFGPHLSSTIKSLSASDALNLATDFISNHEINDNSINIGSQNSPESTDSRRSSSDISQVSDDNNFKGNIVVKHENLDKYSRKLRKRKQSHPSSSYHTHKDLHANKIKKTESSNPSQKEVLRVIFGDEDEKAETNTPTTQTIEKVKSEEQTNANSEPLSYRRSVRKRVRPNNKEYEYDLRNLLKLEAEAYKESHNTGSTPLKTQSKRKSLQNDVPESKNNHIPPQNEYRGALKKMSVTAVGKICAHLLISHFTLQTKFIPVPNQRVIPSSLKCEGVTNSLFSAIVSTSGNVSNKNELVSETLLKKEATGAGIYQKHSSHTIKIEEVIKSDKLCDEEHSMDKVKSVGIVSNNEEKSLHLVNVGKPNLKSITNKFVTSNLKLTSKKKPGYLIIKKITLKKSGEKNCPPSIVDPQQNLKINESIQKTSCIDSNSLGNSAGSIHQNSSAPIENSPLLKKIDSPSET